MTDKELIASLLCCEGRLNSCATCALQGEYDCTAELLSLAAVRIGELMLEKGANAHIEWRPVSEPPEKHDYYLCRVKLNVYPDALYYKNILEYDGEGFREGNVRVSDVTDWVPLPYESPTVEKG